MGQPNNENRFRHICAAVYGQPWAILPDKLSDISDLLQHRIAGEKLSHEEIIRRTGGRAGEQPQSFLLALGPKSAPGAPQKKAMVIPIYGVIAQKMNLMSDISGGTTVDALTDAFRAAMADDSISAVIFDVDSPGGAVEGIPELAAEILAARGKKRTIAVANPMAASAAYWLASAADEIYVQPSGRVGSIGVLTQHIDQSRALADEGVSITTISAGKYKAEGNPFEPLTTQARAHLQETVNTFYKMFVGAVARGRKTTAEAVENGFGQGRMETAQAAVASGLVDGVETFEGVVNKLMPGGNRKVPVPIPARAMAANAGNIPKIFAVKGPSPRLAASGYSRSVSQILAITPGASGEPHIRGAKIMAKSIAERIREVEEKRAPLVGTMKAIMDQAEIDGREMDANEKAQFDAASTELEPLNEDLKRLENFNAAMRTATPVSQMAGESQQVAQRTRQGSGVEVLAVAPPKGTLMARYVIALVKAQGNKMNAAQLARQHFRDMPEVALALQAAAVDPGTTTDTAWAGELVPAARQLGNEFLDLLRPATLIGRIPNLRQVPFNVKVPVLTDGGSYQWVGEAKSKPVTKLAFDSASLGFAKAAGIIVITQELARFSSPSAEQLIRNAMVAGTRVFLDGQFVDPAVGEVAGVHPASITNGINAVSGPSGTTAEAFRYDLNQLLQEFADAGQDPTTAVLLISATIALGLAGMVNAFGQPEFPGFTVNGGTINGIPVLASQTVGDRMILVNANDILFADDGQTLIDLSTQATLEMDSAPVGDDSPPGTPEWTSLWQKNMVGIRVERFITWKRGRDSAVAWMDNVAYAPTQPGSPA